MAATGGTLFCATTDNRLSVGDCAGVTTYNGLRRSSARAGDVVQPASVWCREKPWLQRWARRRV
jgi:hypothetical protein